jgi:diacylglycerol kinase (ATP)
LAHRRGRASGPHGDVARPALRRRVWAIVNRRAGAARRDVATPLALAALFAAHGLEAEVTVVPSTRAVRAAAAAAARRGARLVVAVGGDGSIAAAASALVGTETTLGIVPAGTMNNLAHGLGVPTDPGRAAALIASGEACPIDVGTIRSSADPRERYFFETAGVGITALAAPFGEAIHRGRWRRALGRLGELARAPGTRMRVEFDGDTLFADTQLVAASNAPRVGPRAAFAPGAVMDDGLLDVALFAGMTKAALAVYFVSAMLGHPLPAPRVGVRRARRVVVLPAQPRPATADLRVLPAADRWEIGVLPGGVQVIVGGGAALRGRAN